MNQINTPGGEEIPKELPPEKASEPKKKHVLRGVVLGVCFGLFFASVFDGKPLSPWFFLGFIIGLGGGI